MNSRLEGLEFCPLHKNTPFGFRNVSKTQLSVARYSGVITLNGSTYIYFPDTDELVRDDVLGWKKQIAKNVTEEIANTQLTLA